MTETPKRYACRMCPRDDLSLTANGRVRSHAANGKRPGPDNPNCPGGSDFPRDAEQSTAPVTASGGPNPHRAPLPTGNLPHDRSTEEPKTVTTDAFESAAPVQKAEPKRDRYGRYLLPHPVTGKRQGWTRCTTMAKSISDTFALSQWSQRMTAKGLALRPDLVSLAGTLDVKADKDKLNHLVDQAKDAAGQKVAANLGTTLHTHTENVDAGAPLDSVPPNHRADVAAYRAAMAEAGLIAVPHLIERITVVPQFDTAGTFDRVLLTSDGDYVIGDLKSGRDLQYGWQEIAIQLALYAQGVNESGVYDLAEERWELPDTFEHTMGVAGSPKVRTDYGIVMHLPVGESRCTLYRVDLTAGWAAATLCARVRDWRKTRNLAEPYVVAEAQSSPYLDALAGAVRDPGTVAVRPPTWAEKFEAVSSRGEAMSLYTEALGVLGQGPELDSLVRLGMAKLASTEERAG